MSEEKVNHARFTLPRPDPTLYAPRHPLRNAENHDKLLEYLMDRVKLGAEARDSRVRRYSQIDRDVAAFLKLGEEDQKRFEKHAKDGSPQATEVSLPVGFIHLDDMMTYFAQTFAPNRGMFYHTAQPEDGEDASQLTTLMNSHAMLGGYYRQLLRAIWAILKYNHGGLWNSWDTEYGPKLEATPAGGTRLAQDVTFRGNRIKAVDMYNFLGDPGVELVDLYKEGEFAAEIQLRSHFWLKKRCLEGMYYNCESALDSGPAKSPVLYYKDPPVETRLTESHGAQQGFSWKAFLTGDSSYSLSSGFELITIYINLNPNDFDLVGGTADEKRGRNRYEVWRFTILNGTTVIETTYMNNMHGHLPCYFGVINDDQLGEASKSVSEILNPLQQFSSFLLNVHVLANRKNLYGTTYYDPSCVDMEKIPEGEVAARVPIKPQGYGKDIRMMVQHDSNLLDTKQTLQDMQGMMALIDTFFPTQAMPSQIAGIDRAVDSQVAALQQGTNRRQQKGARLIDDSMLRPMRFGMYYNIVQYQEDGAEVADFYSGKSVTINLDKLRTVNLSTIIGQGLKAIDRQAIQAQFREIIFALIQAPQAAEGIDILGLLDAWSAMMDLETNLKQFQLAPPPQAAEGAAIPGAEGAGESGINPATAPANLVSPIYGG